MSSSAGALRQGEVLSGIKELRFKLGDLTVDAVLDGNIVVEIEEHPMTIVISPDCDLEWDYRARIGQANRNTKLMTHVLLCDLEDQAALHKTRITSSDHLKRVQENRDERYHYLRCSTVEGEQSHSEYFIDFKRLFALPIEFAIQEAESQRVRRLGVLKSPWAQHLSHRFIFFLGRVGLPDDD